MKEYLTPKDLKEELGFSLSWQSKARMKSNGSDLPFIKIGSKVFYKRTDIDAWLTSHRKR